MCVWLQSPRALSCCCALPIKERASQRVPPRAFHVHCTELPVLLCFASALLLSLRLPLVLARPQLLLRPLLLCSRLVLCFALVSACSRLSLVSCNHNTSKYEYSYTCIRILVFVTTALPRIDNHKGHQSRKHAVRNGVQRLKQANFVPQHNGGHEHRHEGLRASQAPID